MGADLGEVTFSWTPREVALYNLAVGGAHDPMDTVGLQYIHDSAPKVLPSFATVAATFNATEAPKVVFPGVDIDLSKVVHGAQQVRVHRPLPASGTATTRTRIAEVQDKGSAAVIIQESVTVDEKGEPLWTARSSIFAKGEGGFGGDRGSSTKVELPDRAADHEILVPTQPNQALLYRLCGDRNPLHSDPEFAAGAGFPRPILHGLCTYGSVCRAVVDEIFAGDVAAVADYGVSFAGVVFPGETLRVRAWEDGDRLLVATTIVDRDDAPALGNVVFIKS
ncbi:3-alpha,7-alpha,12-alpha-trihydroxy-5-beta-chole st-24-enoyl-CoAhydratase [Gordonia neofelifaecis NRRL B-59395]|uniref:3-alpha,7-alpha,12-alpha-trihydroxy-5-beta-chole st-24-enoyl-CoAhydratase n=1 Tax=Gordonia neofelifaecis NRRL B-59395 TaxID=644548 RepID=F1YN28_9ACTN|nr:3-alpha,7-alpha,12-alpha-trihydroxy-5-beta-chole st-24-enoyl-CoAhydratase [Gordonia neofelifaecis NRRL B-59395]